MRRPVRLNRAGDGLATAEDPFRESVEQLASRTGWLWYHTHDSRRSNEGFPDDTFLRDGVQIVAEFKSEEGKTSADQERWLAEYRKVPGCIVRVWRPSDWDEIEAMLTAPRKRRTNDVLADVVMRAIVRDGGMCSVDELRSRTREQPVASERQIAMKVMRLAGDRSLAAIGAAFGRDHTTVLHALRAVDAMGPDVAERIDELVRDCQAEMHWREAGR